MQEWTDPRYAEMVDAIRAEQHPQHPQQDPDRSRPVPVRGFIVPNEPQD